jgi:hypothetical protein
MRRMIVRRHAARHSLGCRRRFLTYVRHIARADFSGTSGNAAFFASTARSVVRPRSSGHTWFPQDLGANLGKWRTLLQLEIGREQVDTLCCFSFALGFIAFRSAPS